MQNDEPAKILTINDISGLGTFFEFNEIPMNLVRDNNGRVLGEVAASKRAYELMALFQSNPTVRLLDFLSYQRRLRGRMLQCRDGDIRTQKGVRRTMYVPGDQRNGD